MAKGKLFKKKTVKITAIILVVIAFLFTALYLVGGEQMLFKKKNNNDVEIIDGGKTDYYLQGYPTTIKSENIVYFQYQCGEYNCKMEKENDVLHIECSGGNSVVRDGTYYVLDYKCQDNGFTKKLQKTVEKYDIIKDNGHFVEAAGIPPGIGDQISIKYDSGEAIYKSDNQSLTISQKASDEIYKTFKKLANDNGFDFTSEGSNVELYNDATVEYLQGSWKGMHFGHEYAAEFDGQHVKIYKDGQLTDDVDYIIYEGSVRTANLKEGKQGNSKYDYQEFSEISCFAKNNDFTLTMYFMKDSYSTDSMLKQ